MTTATGATRIVVSNRRLADVGVTASVAVQGALYGKMRHAAFSGLAQRSGRSW